MNPFAEICGYICPAEKLCEKKCNRHEFDTDPVRIKDMHKWVCGHASDDTGWQKLKPEENGFRVAVVGAGPAGLTCAHYLSRLGYQVDVMDKAGKTGGILTHAIPEFRLPGDVVKREIEGLSRGRINFRLGRSLGVDFKISSINSDYDAVFVAPGLWAGRSLDIPGIEKARTVDAFGFLKSYCKSNTADVPGKVIVIGGGSVAADSAIVAKKSGAESVTLVCLESAGNMPCTPYEESEMKNLGIKIENCLGPEEILSDSKISFSLCKSVFDETGRFCPELDRTKKREMDFGLLIIATGQTMEPSLSKYLNEEFGTAGLIEIDKDTMQIKNRPGIFAGGDIVRGSGTVVQAVGDGRRAAMGIDAYIKAK